MQQADDSVLGNIRAVAFDLDNTLWDVEPVLERAEARMLEWMKEHCPRIPERVSLEEMRATRLRLAAEEPHRAHDLTYLRIAALARHARECGYDERIANLAFEVFFAARNDLEVFDDVRPALERLRRRYVLATLTNGNADLRRIGIADYFAVSLSARDTGVAKPHPLGFTRLAEALGLRPEEILYVGDDPAVDMEGARAAGLRTAWMNRMGAAWPAELTVADLVIRDCEELARRLES